MRISKLTVYIVLIVLIITACGRESEPEAANDSVSPDSAAVETVAESGDTEESAASAESETDGDKALEFTMQSLDGEEVALTSLRGRFVLVNFWATWCAPCRDEMPYLQQISVDHADQLTVLGVNMREEPDRIHPFVEEFGLTFPVLLHPSDDLIMENNVRGLPVSYVVGPEGTVVFRKFGEIFPDEFDAWLAENLEL